MSAAMRRAARPGTSSSPERDRGFRALFAKQNSSLRATYLWNWQGYAKSAVMPTDQPAPQPPAQDAGENQEPESGP